MRGRKTGGRRKGVPNKLTSDVRDMVLNALEAAGGTEYLRAQAAENPGPFLSLVARCLPKEIKAELSAEMIVRQDVRRDLVDQLVTLVNAHAPAILDNDLIAAPATLHNQPKPETDSGVTH